MGFYLIGLNHRTAPVQVREKLAETCCDSLVPPGDPTLEGVAVFTCNRVEFYFHGPEEAAEQLFLTWLQHVGLADLTGTTAFFRLREVEVITHLLRVVSGLDSMVLGENQILHQIKTSYQTGVTMGTVGKYLHALFQKALSVGKQVRTATRISQNTVSIASTAVELAIQIFGPLERCVALIIGAGEMAGLTAIHLRKHRIGSLFFVNRTPERAHDLAARYGGEARPFQELPALLAAADLVVASTGAPRHIISAEQVRAAARARAWRPIFLIDIAMPRDVDPHAADLENVFLSYLDDLQGVVDENIDQRRTEAARAEAMVATEAAAFQQQLQTFALAPLIRAIRQHAENIRQEEIDKFFPAHLPLPTDQTLLRETINQCCRAMLAKFLHHPILHIKEKGPLDPLLVAEIAGLFGLTELSQSTVSHTIPNSVASNPPASPNTDDHADDRPDDRPDDHADDRPDDHPSSNLSRVLANARTKRCPTNQQNNKQEFAV